MMSTTLNTRQATTADIPFLARIEYEASLPPLNHCFWEDLLEGTGTTALEFIEAELKADACNWGNVPDFLILEAEGKPVAAAAGYVPGTEDYCPLRLSQLEAIAKELNWTKENLAAFRGQYLGLWGGNLRPFFLTPQATWIIENVAVLPEARGQGLGKALLRALLEKGRSQGHEFAGIMVINGNDRARHTYESVGFKPYQTFYQDYFSEQFKIDFPGVTKFGLRLN
ncbi:GNAT family N-acetyltransferase [Synechocystis sp. FACHB-383]|uniref:GNAT family N-acetyltransferase n=2 Tax=Synechocystis TaxID=1142 RepID=A0ABR9VSH2_9SYNC|nr:GNAT family N-acetyltransferase [Synechocystis sp. FACHB-383]MBE9193923.1 GNAT family N-acetyltransferase [Synechocystis sp. LEGE 06083]MBE9240824.1 GNAT family N-acetyltransferase [Synechocystis salina LEGE 00041]MBE9254284.1 GNAT family N-acetyltransferase [Synechocystis salina LEGE 00031]